MLVLSLLILLIMVFTFEGTIHRLIAWETDEVAKAVWIQDGDTFKSDKDTWYRLADIDAPEEGQPGYYDAKSALFSKIKDKTVYLDIDDVYIWDSKGEGSRKVCIVYVKHNDTHILNVNQWLVEKDYAVFWNCENEFTPPWSLYIQYYFPPPEESPPEEPPKTPPEEPPPEEPEPPLEKQAPVAIINGPYEGELGDPITFTSAGSLDPDGGSLNYTWYFGDGNTSSLPNVTYTYSSPGSYAVVLKVIDDEGVIDRASTNCIITSTEPSPEPEPPPEPEPEPQPEPSPQPQPEPSPTPEVTKGNLSISIKKATYGSIPYVNITSLSTPNNLTISGVTDSKGKIEFVNIPSGGYTFQAFKEGYRSRTFFVLISGEESLDKQIEMKQDVPLIPHYDSESKSNGLRWEYLLIPIIIGVIVSYFYKDRLVNLFPKQTSKSDIQDSELSESPVDEYKSEKKFVKDVEPERPLYHKDNDEKFDVGTWSAEELGDERKIVFRPFKPLAKSDEGIWVWLGGEITKVGRGSISEKGDVTVFLPRNERYSRILGQVSWVYHTLLKEGNLL